LNASGTGLNGSEERALYVDPIRDIPGTSLLQYNSSTKEISHTNEIYSDQQISITVAGEDSTQKTWYFGNDGDLTFPDATTQTTAFTANPTLNVLKIDDGVHETFALTAGIGAGVTDLDCSLGHITYNYSVSANWTVNLVNLNLDEERATTITIVIDQGGTGYYPNALQIAGQAQTIRWQGNATPTPSSSRVDVVTFSILRTGVEGAEYTVLGQLTGF
jgi:hypothetical protein